MKIAAVIPQNDTTAFYRAWGPLSHLQTLKQLDWYTKQDWRDEDFWQADVVFMQRPCNENHLAIARLAKQLKKPLWVDWDDLLTEIPATNKAHYRLPIYKRVVPEIAHMADLITVSVAELSDRLCGGKAHVLANAWDERFFKANATNASGPVLIWRGGETHEADLEAFSDAFSIGIEHRLWMLGRPGWRIQQRLPHAKVKEFGSIQAYMEFFQGLGGRVLFVPLVDDAFNRCKSNIAWQEATLAGCIVVAPDWPVWHLPGVINYKDAKDAQRLLSEILASSTTYQLMHKRSMKHLESYWRLSDINIKRMQLVNRLVYR